MARKLAASDAAGSTLDSLNAYQLRILQEASYAGCVRVRTSAWGKPDDEGVAKLGLSRDLCRIGLLEFVEKTGDEWSVIHDATYCYVLSERGAALIAEHKARLRAQRASAS